VWEGEGEKEGEGGLFLRIGAWCSASGPQFSCLHTW
jgi:hypothetical protein